MRTITAYVSCSPDSTIAETKQATEGIVEAVLHEHLFTSAEDAKLAAINDEIVRRVTILLTVDPTNLVHRDID